MSLNITDKAIDKFLSFLFRLDKESKLLLISKLRNSMKPETPKKNAVDIFFGSWKDSRSSDEIIEDIRSSYIGL